MKRYNPKEIEPKWQKIWRETNAYTADLKSSKPTYFSFGMFNYPSGNLHVGHAMNFTISDVMSRFKRQQGFESYHPVGWDSFGLPAENYAIKAGISPQESMAQLIPNYREKYQAMGWSDDWEKEITTSEPEYYKWTQWIFVKMHEHGLAYQDSRWQWWCTKCQTVLANEQVIDGKCWRHDGADDPIVEKKEVKQWFFKITDYADELLDATDSLNWTPSVKLAQKNWIGRKQGIEITYDIEGANKSCSVTCFTTRPDTNFGATFIVISPEHELVERLVSGELTADAKPDVAKIKKYVRASQSKTEVERQQEGRKKTGVFTGLHAINMLNGRRLPIWIADFVLAGFGTGAVVGVPGHDLRDFEFAKAFDLPIERVVVGADNNDAAITESSQVQEESGTMINSGFLNGLEIHDATEKMMDHMEEKGMGERVTTYRMRDWSVSRQRYWGAPIPVVHCPDCGPVVLSEKDLPVVLPELTDFKPSGDGRSALARAKDWLTTTCPKCKGPAERETDTMDTYVDSAWYMLRYLDPHNQSSIFDTDIANKWMPVNFYNGADHATAHLLYARFITRFFHKIGLVNEPEPFKQMLYNGKVTAQDGSFFSKTKGNGPDPVEIINSGYGADALRTYLMFAAPLEMGARWDPQGVPGTHRFLSRLWNLAQEYLEQTPVELDQAADKKLLGVVHKAAQKVTEDIEANRFNTAIAASMEAVNKLYLLKTSIPFGKSAQWQEALEFLVMLVAPFAPHIADELWQQLGHSDSVNKDHWPDVDQAYLQDDLITLVVQVNGKLRAQLQLPANVSKEDALYAAKQDAHVLSFTEGKSIKKEIFVPGKLINLVVS